MTLCAINMLNPVYDPKVGWNKLTSVTYGTMPPFEDFKGRFDAVCPSGLFAFTNDKRVGSASLDVGWLWNEIAEARAEFMHQHITLDAEKCPGTWCSDVLGKLGWEWA